METQETSKAIPCSICGNEPALPHNKVTVTAFGLGNVTIYLCEKDYTRLRASQQAEEAHQTRVQQGQTQTRQVLEEAAAVGYALYKGEWPSLEVLWGHLKTAEQAYDKARSHYREAEDATEEERKARLQVLHMAALCLYHAVCIEAVAKSKGKQDSAVSGTLARVTRAFSKKGGLIHREKTISTDQVIETLQILIRHRQSNPSENEEEELRAIALNTKQT